MDKIFTQRNLLILAIVILLIWVWWKFIRKSETNPNGNLSNNQNISNTNTSNNTSSTSNNTPAVTINPNFGKTAYASFDNVSVYQGVISSATVYKIAKKNEWIGTVEGETGSWWKVSGNRLVSKGGVYLK